MDGTGWDGVVGGWGLYGLRRGGERDWCHFAAQRGVQDGPTYGWRVWDIILYIPHVWVGFGGDIARRWMGVLLLGCPLEGG
jgi:hypothetical protein